MTAKQLREERAKIALAIRQLADKANDEKRDFLPEEQGNWDQINKDYDSLSRAIEIAERVEKVDDDLASAPTGRPGLDNEDRDERAGHATRKDLDLRIEAWARAQSGLELERRHVDACRRTGTNPHAPELHLQLCASRAYAQMRSDFEARAMGVGTGGGGTASPEIVSEGFVSAIEKAMLFFGPMRQVASIIRTESGNAMPWPTVNDTGNTGALLAENTAVAEQDLDVAAITFDAYKYSSKLVRVSVELLQDNAVDLPSLLGELLGERLGRITNTHFTTGTGTAQPNGIVTASTLGKTTAVNNAITADELMDLYHSVDPAYRRTGCGWMFRDATIAVIRKLKDTTNQYLWQSGLASGQPDILLGFPVHTNPDIAAIATTAKVGVFGFLPLYKIREVIGITMLRLRERYADLHQEGFLAFLRTDGDLLNAGVAPVKHLAMAV